MNRFRKQFILGSLFLIFIICAVITLNQWRNNRGEILIRTADFFETLALPYRIAKLSAAPPDEKLLIPVHGLLLDDISNNWGDPRSGGRSHEGIDIFAKKGTPVYSATEGYILRAGQNELGGNIVFVSGKGGIKYYYAHLERIAEGISLGSKVTTDTILGYVGNTGNATSTDPHLHFGMYDNGPQNPYPNLSNR